MKKVEILWASTREAYNFLQAKQLKCEIKHMWKERDGTNLYKHKK